MRTLRYPITGTIDTTVRTRARATLATMFLMMGMFLTMGAFLTMGTGVALADILNVPSQYATIQAAIDAAQAGDQILVEPGTYSEQLVLDKDLTITGAGVDQTVLRTPATLSHFWPPWYYCLVHVENTASGHIENMTIDGAGEANAYQRFIGVGFFNSGGSVRHCEIINMTETPVTTLPNGVGIYTMNTAPNAPPYILDLADIFIHDYQKGGIVVSGSPYVVTITDVVVDATTLGSGSGQNGIEVGLRADATITNCDIRGHHFPFANHTSCGMLSYLGGTINIADSIFDQNQTSVYFLDSGGSLDGCTLYGTGTYPAYDGVTTVSFGSAKDGLPPDIPTPLPFCDEQLEAFSVGEKNWSSLTLRDCIIAGFSQIGTRGVQINVAGDDVTVSIDRCNIFGWDFGVEVFENSGSSLTGTCRYTRIAENSTFGFQSNTIVPFDARWNWWNDPTGPSGIGPGGGDPVSFNVIYDPFLKGNVICIPEPLEISLADWDGAAYRDEMTVYYVGGGSGPVYGYSMEVAWDPGVVTAGAGDFQRPDSGPFNSAPFFLVTEMAPGQVRIDAALGGAHPGAPKVELFKATFTAVGAPAYAESELTLTINDFRDPANNPLTGFSVDHGRVVVDLESPVLTSVAITNTTLAHTDDFLKNGDAAQVTATITDGGSGIDTITADLSGLGGGSAVSPDSFVGNVATWLIASTSTTPLDGTVTVTVGAIDLLGNSGFGSDDIIADNTPPTAVTGFAASPHHNRIDMVWDDPTTTDLYFHEVVIRRAVWGDYPLYDTAAPDYPADHAAGVAVWNGAGINTSEIFATDGSERDIVYYQAFARDMAWNYGPADPGARDRATNYWLGDISDGTICGLYDGYVDIADVSCMGATYGLGSLDPLFFTEADIGPTDDFSPLGIPLPDDTIDFEDLMIIALQFNEVGPAKRPAIPGSQTPLLALVRLDERTWSLRLREPCADLKGIHLTADLPEGVRIQVTIGECLAGQDAPVFLRNIDRHGLDTGLAVLGKESVIAGEGELCRMILSQPAELANVAIEARGILNEPFDVAVEETAEMVTPVLFALAPNYPNPFNPVTKISFTLPKARPVRLAVYTLAGRLVTTLVNEERDTGTHEVVWNGCDDRGQLLASGTYFYRIEAGPDSQTRKMVLMK